MKKKQNALMLFLMTVLLVGCTETEEIARTEAKTEIVKEVQEASTTETKHEAVDSTQTEEKENENNSTAPIETKPEPVEEQAKPQKPSFSGYTVLKVDGGHLSGYRMPNVVVDIGFGEREYWAFTNEHGQLVRVIAQEIILQDDQQESVTSSGRYYTDEAKVPGVERDDLDEGHVIADSLGGVSNAYNITPQDSTLNRHGDQAYMERVIRDAGGATNFEAVITYPDTKTQIPSHYQYTYTVRGTTVVDSFENGNPDKINESLGLTKQESSATDDTEGKGDLAFVDTNGNGKVTIQEAKNAGYKMPITRDHWLYPYMHDADQDGLVGE